MAFRLHLALGSSPLQVPHALGQPPAISPKELSLWCLHADPPVGLFCSDFRIRTGSGTGSARCSTGYHLPGAG